MLLLAAGRSTDSPSSIGRAAPVAIVSTLSGVATRIDPSGGRREVRRFDWLHVGSMVETTTESTLVLVFHDGRRWTLLPASSALVRSSGIEQRLGELRSLPPLTPLPLGMTGSEGLGGRAAAVRIRGVQLLGLYPHDAVSTLPEATILRFTPVPAASRYHVEVEAEDGRVVFEADAIRGEITVPAVALQAGVRYHWRVRSVGLEPAAYGRASFQTLVADKTIARAALRARLELEHDASSLALLAEIDRSLGLLWEAREGFRSALALSPDDDLRAALEQTERSLASSKEP
jgi:hypothetical protein